MRDASASNYLNCPRVAACAIAPEPAWLWSEDGSRALWANAAGASLFNAANVAELTARHFGPSDAERQQVIRLAETLANDGAPRLERLRVFGAGLLMQPLVCSCSRLPIDDETTAILISGVEPLRPALSLDDRVRQLTQGDGALASFTIAGDLVFATEPARQLLSSASNIAAIEASALATDAISQGRATGTIPLGPVVIWRVGRDAETLLIVRFDVMRAQPSTDSPDQALAGPTNYGYAENISQAIALAKSSAIPPRRHPLRFVWELDPEQHFTVKSDEFLALAGAATAQKNGALWGEICASLNIDPYQQVSNAIATHDTWSGIVLSWPTATGGHVRVELSGLPVFDRQRQFGGYRGFGVCRDTPQLARLTMLESSKPPQSFGGDLDPETEPAPALPDALPPALSVVPSSANVVPFPAAASSEQRSPGLSDGDRRAFSDIAQQLAARLRASARPDGAAAKGEEPAALAASPLHPPRIDGRAVANASGLTEDDDAAWFAGGSEGRALLDLLPFGILIYRASEMLHANPAFLQRLGYATLEDFSESGGLDMLQLAPEQTAEPGVKILAIETEKAGQIEARLMSMPHDAGSLNVVVLADQDTQVPITALTRATIRESGPDRALDKIHEHQLDGLRQRLDQTAAGHTEFRKRINRDLRTPLTAIMGFAETILGERFGPIGNERYRDYLSGIRNAGSRILALVDELEREPQAADEKDTAKKRPAHSDIDLNRIVQACVAELQPEASRDRVLIRTSLHRGLPEIAADAGAVRQIVLNLLTNSIRLAGAGGQVIISTGVSGAGAVSLRLRDTGAGLNETDVAEALQGKPAAGVHPDASESRLKLAVAKALVEANRASLKISSKPEEGTLVEVSFHEMPPPAA
jgi:signal transduction histidine kinase